MTITVFKYADHDEVWIPAGVMRLLFMTLGGY